MKFFGLNFEFLKTYEQVCMHFSLNSAPCRPVQPLDFIKLLIFGVFGTLSPLNKGFTLREIIFE